MLRKIFIYYILFGAIFAGLLIFFIKQETKVPYALEVDAIKDTTDMAGTYYRIRVNNVGINSLSNISVYLGKNDVQNLNTLAPGESFFFYPKPETNLEKIIITAKEGINITADYRTPLKGIGLTGSGR